MTHSTQDHYCISRAFIGVGSNLGDRMEHLSEAARLLHTSHGVLTLESAPVYETRPVGLAGPGKFYNTVFRVEIALTPMQLLSTLQHIEVELGRPSAETHATLGARAGARTIDLDLLFYDDLEFQNDHLTIPHPFAHCREFVMRPMCDLNPEHVHPELGLPMRDLLQAIPPSDQILGVVSDTVATIV